LVLIFGQILSTSGPYFSGFKKNILATIEKIWKKKIKISSIHGQASLVVSKSIILCIEYSKFSEDYKTISIFWSLIFQNPVVMVLKFWKV
jgi:hypothetical protein